MRVPLVSKALVSNPIQKGIINNTNLLLDQLATLDQGTILILIHRMIHKVKMRRITMMIAITLFLLSKLKYKLKISERKYKEKSESCFYNVHIVVVMLIYCLFNLIKHGCKINCILISSTFEMFLGWSLDSP